MNEALSECFFACLCVEINQLLLNVYNDGVTVSEVTKHNSERLTVRLLYRMCNIVT